MAKRRRKKKDDSGCAGILLLILLSLIVLLIGISLVAIPIVAVGGAIYYFFPFWKKRKKIKGTLSDFWLNNYEKERFRTAYNKVTEALINIDKANEIGDAEGLPRKKDGTFALRGKRAKEIQSFINYNKNVVYDYDSEVRQLKTLPQKRWLEFREIYVRFFKFYYAAIAWFITAEYLISQNFSKYSEGFAVLARFPVDLVKMVLSFFGKTKSYQNPDIYIQWEILLISGGIAILTYFIVSKVAKIYLKRVTPYPPEVDADNYNKF